MNQEVLEPSGGYRASLTAVSISPPTNSSARANRLQCRVLGRRMTAVLRGSPEYHHQQTEYFTAQQAALKPCCWLLPESKEDVAFALHILSGVNASFAIKSGGHAILTGASNVDGGVTVDLSRLSHVEVLGDPDTVGEADVYVKVGAGARWGKVYTTLLEKGLAVAGGRIADVGVGGYLLGGGLSYFSNRLGWACDNVLSFEIVLANGTIVTAAENLNEDLFWALRGGGSQFGVLTEFTLRAWKQAKVWTGVVSYDERHMEQVVGGLRDFNLRASENEHAAGWVSYATIKNQGRLIQYTSFVEVNGNSTKSSAVFNSLNSIPMQHDGRRIQEPLQLALDSHESRGRNQWEATLTFHNRADVMMAIVNILRRRTKADIDVIDADTMVALTFQPLTKNHLSHTDNVFGIDPADGPLICHFLQVSWLDVTKSNFYNRFARSIFDEIENAVQKMEAAHPFRYMNYAADFQDVYASYGEESLARLRAIRDNVDQHHVFTRLVPGGLEL